MSFLKAEWRKLALANYAVDPKILEKYVPHGTELDLWNNTCYVSLVGFMFLNTKLLGVPIPFHINFEEVNLRFYVKTKYKGEWRRGVVFIKELVPKPALTFVANTVYQEHYQTVPMSHHWHELQDQREVTYAWKYRKENNVFSVKANLQPEHIPANSETEFITEHYWGYTQAKGKATYEYEVTHPRWEAYPVQDYTIDVNFSDLYGEEFGVLSKMEPKSVMLAEGSKITVENKRRL
ncbi:YqjF family protein [Fulvivirga sediminis]|uniref:DUF2071 domain-containing protein n=1 Tax=Fulvivirga sediminis TaxID=2803949 RepID=A0A937K289_9BACT|nr:DUF2071 domain-containing protein [Fulvivirga sediminis]MBL3658316.1 DUF2071 domain-containing protein [Fulvivirga sediminis]